MRNKYPRIHFPDIPFKDGELYRPSNGTEGYLFQEGWCYHCKRDVPFQLDPENHDGCSILARAYRGEKFGGRVREWIFKDRMPICTAFKDVNGPPDDPLSPEERAAQLTLTI